MKHGLRTAQQWNLDFPVSFVAEDQDRCFILGQHSSRDGNLSRAVETGLKSAECSFLDAMLSC